jgi:hypothetical protein
MTDGSGSNKSFVSLWASALQSFRAESKTWKCQCPCIFKMSLAIHVRFPKSSRSAARAREGGLVLSDAMEGLDERLGWVSLLRRDIALA